MKKLTVLFDCRWIYVDNRHDGISRYSNQLAIELAKRDDVDVHWLIYDKRQLKRVPKGPYMMVVNPEVAAWHEFLFTAREINRYVAANNVDVVYSPAFAMGTLGRKYKLVLTIHDLTYYTYRTPPQWLKWHVRAGWWLFHSTYWPLRLQLNRADVIATVSETAKQQLIDARVTKRDIVTVSNAVAEHFADPTPRQHYKSNDFFFIGMFTPYKNPECIIDAMQYLPDMTLHFTSRAPKPRLKQLQEYAAARGVLGQIVFHNGVSDEEMQQIITSSRCGVSASKTEGFGLPLIETQQAGVPFAASDIPIFREIGQDSVLYFDPTDPKALAKCVEAFGDKATSEEYIRRGHKNTQRFSWARSAEAAAQLCKKIAQK